MRTRSLSLMRLGGVVAVVALLAPGAPLSAQATPSLGSVSLPKKVMADGQPLAAGTYSLRLSSEAVKPVVGQPAESERWVEFVQGGKVKGRELASVVAAADVKQIAKMATPGPGGSKVQMLKGSEYIRVWVNRAGTHYLLHLTSAP
jgi:hypothetical protein